MNLGIPKIFLNFWKKARLPEIQEPTNRVRHYQAALILERTPSNSAIGDRDFVFVIYETVPRWALFRCPCGCSEVISLPLAAPHNPRWAVYVDEDGFASLYPSVWRNTGCMSHFVIRSGCVFWANKSGVSPFEASPNFYKPRIPK
jgi:Family of unknown function (DUF6527)